MPDASDEKHPYTQQVFAALAGDHRLYAQVITPLTVPLFRTAARVLRSEDAAEEVVQDALCTLWAKRHKVDFDGPRPLGTWLWRVATNLCCRRRSWFGRLVQWSADVPEPAAPDGGDEATAEAAATLALVRAAAARLTPLQQVAVAVYEEHRLPHEQQAAALNMTVNNYRVFLHRVRRQLVEYVREADPAAAERLEGMARRTKPAGPTPREALT